MTINTESTKRTYNGNGVATQFDYDFKIFVESDLRVSLVDDVTGLETLQVLNVDYTITGEGFEAGGKATFVTPPPTGNTVILLSNVPYTQPTDYKNQGRFFPETVENNLDRATRQILQLDERSDRSLLLPVQVVGVSTQLPVPEAGKIIGWALDGLSLVNYTNGGGGGGGGEVNTASNLGAGEGQVYASKSGADLRFRSIKQGTNVTITQSGTEITINAAGGGGGGGSVTSVGLTSTSPTAISVTGTSPITSSGAWSLNLGANLLAWNTITPPSKADTTAVASALALKADLAALAASSGSSLVGFINVGTGAVLRTMQDRERDWMNVRDYGAVGDGSTDDRAKIVLADAAAAAAGKRLFFPAGTYMVSAHITGLKAAWLGEAGSTIKATGSLVLNLEAMLSWSTVDDISIRDLAFDLQSRPVTVGSEAIVALINCGGFEVANCRFINMTGCGLTINGGRRFIVRDCLVSKATATSTYNQAMLLSSSSRLSREGWFLNNRMQRSAINLAGVDIWVDNNYITGWGFGAGITTEQDSNNSTRYRITNNIIEDSLTVADANLYRPGGIENWGPYSVISGNHISGCGGTGIDQGGQYCIVSNNFVFNNGTSGTDSTPGPQAAGGDGIVSRYGDSTFNGNFSTICGNIIGDLRASGDKLQGYGYADQNASITGIVLHGNKYVSNFSGDENILGTTGWYVRPLSNGDYKVSTSGAGKWEFTCPVTFTGTPTFSGNVAFGSDIALTSGNRVRLNGQANGHGIRWSSPNIEMLVGGSFAAGFGTNTVGFNGTTPVAKPTVTGSRGGNAALASLLTALDSMGLITNSSTA